MPDFKLISADSHVNEPPAAWERVQKEYGDRAPKVLRDPPGSAKGTWLVTEGMPPIGCSHYNIGRALTKEKGISMIDEKKYADTIKFNEVFRYEDYPGGWDPAARLEDQDTDGVGAEVLFSSPARFFYALTDEPFQRAILRSYAAWLNDFCNYDRKRLIGLPLLSILDIEHTVADLQEYAKLGFKGVQIPTRIKDSGYYEKEYEPLWAAAVDAGLVISVHTTSTQGQARTHFEGPREFAPWKEHLGFARTQAPAQEFLGNLIFSGVFDRHPDLKVSCAEFDVGWIAHLFERIDYFFGRTSAYDSDLNVNKLPPSEYLKKNVFFTFQDDRSGMLTTPVYGEDNFLWASDYPHGVTSWPYSQKTLASNCEGLDPKLHLKVGRQNTAKLFNLEM
jgi:predicted TIM-barrel fold metal-dependent hydrolase